MRQHPRNFWGIGVIVQCLELQRFLQKLHRSRSHASLVSKACPVQVQQVKKPLASAKMYLLALEKAFCIPETIHWVNQVLISYECSIVVAVLPFAIGPAFGSGWCCLAR